MSDRPGPPPPPEDWRDHPANAGWNPLADFRGAEPHASWYDELGADASGCGSGPGRFGLGLLLVIVAMLLIFAAGWVRTDRAVARCVDSPQSVGCAAPTTDPNAPSADCGNGYAVCRAGS